MATKIKSVAAQLRPAEHKSHPTAHILSTPLRGESRLSSGSGLKSLSLERDIKKMTKLKASPGKPENHLLHSLDQLQLQCSHLRTEPIKRATLGRGLPLSIKGVPHMSITLQARKSLLRSNEISSCLHSRSHSQCEQLRVVPIGSECERHRKPAKKKGIHISLLQNRRKH